METDTRQQTVTLKNNFVVTLEVLQLAWRIEEAGFRLTALPDGRLLVSPGRRLPASDVALLQRHKPELHAIVAYEASDEATA